jgi:hypothetical protein
MLFTAVGDPASADGPTEIVFHPDQIPELLRTLYTKPEVAPLANTKVFSALPVTFVATTAAGEPAVDPMLIGIEVHVPTDALRHIAIWFPQPEQLLPTLRVEVKSSMLQSALIAKAGLPIAVVWIVYQAAACRESQSYMARAPVGLRTAITVRLLQLNSDVIMAGSPTTEPPRSCHGPQNIPPLQSKQPTRGLSANVPELVRATIPAQFDRLAAAGGPVG